MNRNRIEIDVKRERGIDRNTKIKKERKRDKKERRKERKMERERKEDLTQL